VLPQLNDLTKFTVDETTPPYAPRSSRFGSMEDDVDVWCYAILELHARNDDDRINRQTDRRTSPLCKALHL